MVAIIQPTIPHYRNDFFSGLLKSFSIDFYNYGYKSSLLETHEFKEKRMLGKSIKGINFFFNTSLLSSKYKVVVCMLSVVEISTWILLLTKPFHKKKIIVWGQGISIPKYESESKKPSFLKCLMIYLADEVWLYTKIEKEIWSPLFLNKPIIALNNTISSLSKILDRSRVDKDMLRQKYRITESRVMICCTRFESEHKRADILLTIMKSLPTDIALILLGGGKNKPDFSAYSNVYDFGPVYDEEVKKDLFGLSDLYIQPAWIGLSVVEAFAYGLPVFTLQRSNQVLQCVEFGYIKHQINGYIAVNELDLLKVLRDTSLSTLEKMGENAKNEVMVNLRMEDMVERASRSIKNLLY